MTATVRFATGRIVHIMLGLENSREPRQTLQLPHKIKQEAKKHDGAIHFGIKVIVSRAVPHGTTRWHSSVMPIEEMKSYFIANKQNMILNAFRTNPLSSGMR
ncbi:hypothetical protein BaRGS_00002826 [Batillaria attramentaria]|uniref:Uncharacterized protein n=1 Tax=Batillaria attramentaria TaxID=370345 RepID=A0ABD0M2G5_9CAEN